ncbi:nucleoside 2-deoxyribosyltransferase [Candidatus Woesearchaeota archaeon]|nr:nucleoside 2-deoxyribosyltransferase [Candidatus Woesearchaeota archaeon]MBW3016403.1 nucleoside 2-deoxyribosyltransferase [Candidatus Woesearchaeota archaeon]
MKVFVSYRFTGENKKELNEILPEVCETLKSAGHDHYCSFFDSAQFEHEKWSGKKILQKAFSEIDISEVVLFFVRTSDVSQGMLVELGYSLAKNKKIVLLINNSVKDSIFRRQIEHVVEFDDMSDLKDKLVNLKL